MPLLQCKRHLYNFALRTGIIILTLNLSVPLYNITIKKIYTHVYNET